MVNYDIRDRKTEEKNENVTQSDGIPEMRKTGSPADFDTFTF